MNVVPLLQVRALLDHLSEKLTTFSEVGISPAHADHIFSELTTFEERVCVSLSDDVISSISISLKIKAFY